MHSRNLMIKLENQAFWDVKSFRQVDNYACFTAKSVRKVLRLLDTKMEAI